MKKTTTLQNALLCAKSITKGKGNVVLTRLNGEWHLAAETAYAQLVARISTRVKCETDGDIRVSVSGKTLSQVMEVEGKRLNFLLDFEEGKLVAYTNNKLKKFAPVDRSHILSKGTVKSAKLDYNVVYKLPIEVIGDIENEATITAEAAEDETGSAMLDVVESLPFAEIKNVLKESLLNALKALSTMCGTVCLGHDRYYSCNVNFGEPVASASRVNFLETVCCWGKNVQKKGDGIPLFAREFSMPSQSADAINKVFDGYIQIQYQFADNTLLVASNGLYLVVPIGPYTKYSTTENTEEFTEIKTGIVSFPVEDFEKKLEKIKPGTNGKEIVEIGLQGESLTFHVHNPKIETELEVLPFMCKGEELNVNSDFKVTAVMSELRELADQYKNKEAITLKLEQNICQLTGDTQTYLKFMEFNIRRGAEERVLTVMKDAIGAIADKKPKQAYITDKKSERTSNADIEHRQILANKATKKNGGIDYIRPDEF